MKIFSKVMTIFKMILNPFNPKYYIIFIMIALSGSLLPADSIWTTGESATYKLTGNVGIGTSNPETTLRIWRNPGQGDAIIGITAGACNTLWFSEGEATNVANIKYDGNLLQMGACNSNQLIFNQSGVGIGAANTGYAMLYAAGTSLPALMTTSNAKTYTVYMTNTSADTNSSIIRLENSYGAGIFSSTQKDIFFSKVLIGTSYINPDFQLNVSGGINTSGGTTTYGMNVMNNSASKSALLVQNQSADGTGVYVVEGCKYGILSNAARNYFQGYLDIGAVNGTAKVNIIANDKTAIYASTTGNNATILTTNSTTSPAILATNTNSNGVCLQLETAGNSTGILSNAAKDVFNGNVLIGPGTIASGRLTVAAGTTGPSCGIYASGPGYGMYTTSSSGYGLYAKSDTAYGIYAVGGPSSSGIYVTNSSATAKGLEINNQTGTGIYSFSAKDILIGKVGIGGILEPTKALHVKGDGYFTGIVTTGSSRTLKKDIKDLSEIDALKTLKALKPVQYRYKADQTETLRLGFIAEDVPELVAEKDRKSLNDMNFTTLAISVIQTQQKQIEALEKKVAELEKKL